MQPTGLVHHWYPDRHPGAGGRQPCGFMLLDAEFIDLTRGIMEQVRLVVESQRSERIPTDPRDELHLKIPNASGIAYRKYLRAIQGTAAYLP